MKLHKNNLLIILFIVLIFFTADSCKKDDANKSPNFDWMKCYGGIENDDVYYIINTNDGNYLVVGSTYRSKSLVIKIDISGNIIWERNYNYESISKAVVNNNSEGYLIVGSTWSSEDGTNVWLNNINKNGEVIWEKSIGGSAQDIVNSIIKTNGNGYLLVGATFSSDGDITHNFGEKDVWVVKIDEFGEIIWEKCFGGLNWEEAYCVKQLDNGNFIIAGESNSFNDNLIGHYRNDYYVLKVSSTGVLIDEKNFGSGDDDCAFSLSLTNDSCILIVGEASDASGEVSMVHDDSRDIWVIKLDYNLNLIWEKSYGGSTWEGEPIILETGIGEYIFTCWTASSDGDISFNHGNYDTWVVKINNQGLILDDKSYGGSKWEKPKSIISNPVGGIVIAGYSNSNDKQVIGNSGKDDFWIISTSSTH